jgi:hypothetical protein
MTWSKDPDGAGWYYVVHKGVRTVGRYDPLEADGTVRRYPVSLVRSGATLMVAEITAWCRIPDPPPVPLDLQ